ncbi:expressed unknown protein [Seminavis robusta]|uniref:Uncharacterized protein n=1 Tax=Seminavis robusta TaxID=568900 RepID=A0A9N8HPR9_9STRA|nr:expressed unknown protein [Seminavis robusta]|eukprot:Sro1122_g243470.1 n/a (644) ;mRNA; r:4531-6599
MNCTSSVVSAMRLYGWKLTVCLLTLALELWVFLLVVLLGKANDLQVNLILINCLHFFAIIGLLGCTIKMLYDKAFAKEDLTRLLAFGDDYWPPFPRWEWNSPPLLWNVVDYDFDDGTGWSKLYPEPKQETALVDTGNTKPAVTKFFKDAHLPATMKQVYFLDPGSVDPAQLTEYELEYLATAAEQKLPSLVVCVCYLLAKESNAFLMESISYFTQVHKAPLYVMVNAREEGTWIYDQLLQLSGYLQNHHLHQVRIFFVNSSRSKATNLNAFIDVLPPPDQETSFKYVCNYDVDDRPTFNEVSLLTYAEKAIGKRRSGHTIVGIQGPCLECYNGTVSGLLECSIEYAAQAASGILSWEARFLGKVRSQGSNHLVLTSAFRRFRFNKNVLLEDWRWSNDMLEKENLSLAYVRTMVCFGQTPNGWNAIAKRRNRWNKGRHAEALNDAFGRRVIGPCFADWVMVWVKLVMFFVVNPLLHMFIIIGYGVIFGESYKQGRYGTLNSEKLEDNGVNGVLGILWNYSWIGSLAGVCGINLAYFILSVVHLESSSFLNGRNTPSYKMLHILMHFFDMFSLFLKPLSRAYQYEYYCGVELLLEKALFQKVEWVATPKLAKETSTLSASEHDMTAKEDFPSFGESHGDLAEFSA